jgi:hypothetical protein
MTWLYLNRNASDVPRFQINRITILLRKLLMRSSSLILNIIYVQCTNSDYRFWYFFKIKRLIITSTKWLDYIWIGMQVTFLDFKDSHWYKRHALWLNIHNIKIFANFELWFTSSIRNVRLLMKIVLDLCLANSGVV